jgi:hypothetical protein
MTTEQVDLVIEKGGGCVGSGSGMVIHVTFLVFGAMDILLALCTFPGVAWKLKEPGVIEAYLGGCMTTKNEDKIVLGRCNGNMLRPGGWQLVTCELLLCP